MKESLQGSFLLEHKSCISNFGAPSFFWERLGKEIFRKEKTDRESF